MTPFKTAHPVAMPPIYSQILACIGIEPKLSGALDLLMGYHPVELRWLTEQEARAGDLLWLINSDPPVTGGDRFSRSIALWQQHWPFKLSEAPLPRVTWDMCEVRWRQLMPHCVPLAAAYVFSTPGGIPSVIRSTHDQKSKAIFDNVMQTGHAQARNRDCVSWTTHFSTHGTLGKLFEQLCGLTEEVKTQLGINSTQRGLLVNYVNSHEGAIDTLLSPQQFEYLVADIYSAEGWECIVTQYSKDGGIDIEARRTYDGLPCVALIQAKCYRSSRVPGKRKRAVDIHEVKEFVATVGGKKQDVGVLVSTCDITKDARKWAATEGRNVATVQLVDGLALRDRLVHLANGFRQGDIQAFMLDVGAAPKILD